MTNRVCYIIALLMVFPAFVYSQGKIMTDLERIGTADIIIVGTIVKTDDIGKASGIMLITNNKSLKGEAPQSITIINLASFRQQTIKLLDIGTQHIFYLQRIRDGYTLTHGQFSLRPVTDIDKIIKLLKDFPLIVTINQPLKPFIFYKPSEFMATINNISNTSISFSKIELQGFFESKEITDTSISRFVGPEVNNKNIDIIKTIILQPHTGISIPLSYQIYPPPAWILTANVKKLDNPTGDGSQTTISTPIQSMDYLKFTTGLSIRVRISIDLETPRKNVYDIYYVSSPLSHTTLHFVKPTYKNPTSDDTKTAK